MTDPEKPARRYGDKEIGALLKRATEIQHAEPSAAAAGGLTLDELEEIAREAGIDPRHLRRAALEIESGRAGGSLAVRSFGEEMELVYELSVPGELPEDRFEYLVPIIESRLTEHGQPAMLGRTLTWRAETPGKQRTIQVTVSVRDGETHIRLAERLQQLVAGLFTGTVVGVGTGVGLGIGLPLAGLVGSVLLAATFPFGIIGITWVSARAIYRTIVRKRRRALTELLDVLASEIRRLIAEQTVEAAQPWRELPRG